MYTQHSSPAFLKMIKYFCIYKGHTLQMVQIAVALISVERCQFTPTEDLAQFKKKQMKVKNFRTGQNFIDEKAFYFFGGAG